MVDSVVTKQELIDAQKDAQSLEDFINGPADTRVKPRIGPEMWTIATINSLVQQGQIKISDLSEAIQTALAAGAGSAGWTANLVADGNQTQKEINLYGGKKYDMPVGGYPLNARIMLDDGDIVKSTVANNTKNPNVDMTGWVKTRDASQIFDASGLNQQQINDEVISIFRFGAICDGTLHKAQEWIDNGRFNSFAQLQNAYPSAVSVDDSIDTLAIEKAIAAIGATGHVRVGGKPVFNRTIKLNHVAGRGIRIFANNLCTLKFVHGGDGILIEGKDALVGANFGSHVLENLDLDGGDPLYPPAGYVRQNTGSGLKVINGYFNTFINVKSHGFKNGYYMRQGFRNNTVGDCAWYGNELGLNLDGHAANLNDFSGSRVRLNWVGGRIDGYNKGQNYYPSRNVFRDVYFESNIKYVGGYLPSPGDGSYNVGLILSRTYHNIFDGAYFENHEFDIIFENNSSRNKFINTRHGASNNPDKVNKILFRGLGVNGNVFFLCDHIKDAEFTTSLISDNANQFHNKFLDCNGFIFNESEIACYHNLTVRGLTKDGLINGERFGGMSRDADGYTTVGLGVVEGDLAGLGTTTATLNAKGYGEMLLGSNINQPTTITSITGLRRGQIFVLTNYQATAPITIKASTDGINGLVLNGRRDCVLSTHSDSITFLVTGLGKIVEIGRTVQTGASPVEQSVGTWTPIVKNSGGTTIATTTATGRWVKNGRQLTVWFDIVASSDLTEPNHYLITGMPNLPQFAQNGAGQVSSATNAANANQKDVFSVDAATTGLTIRVSTQANFSNSDGFAGCATYIIA